jgi:peptidyl-Lys metalloendopeptidase
MNRVPLLALALLAILSTHCTKAAVSDASAQPLECRLDAIHPLTAGSPIAIRFRLTNRTDEPLWMLRWNTPFEGWRGTIFTVTSNGTEIPYQGPMVKRGDPAREDYVKIPAGESVSASVDLSEVYEIRKPGLYDVKVTGGLQDVAKDVATVPRTRELLQAMELGCEGITLEVKVAE